MIGTYDQSGSYEANDDRKVQNAVAVQDQNNDASISSGLVRSNGVRDSMGSIRKL